MCLLAQFSRFISVPLLTEWLSCEDVLAYDAAQCCDLGRHELHCLYYLHKKQFEELFFHKKADFPFSFAFFSWLQRVGLSPSHYSIRLNNMCLLKLRSSPPERAKTLLTHLSMVRSIKFDNCSASQLDLLAGILTNCSNLEELILTDSERVQGCVEAAAKYCHKLKTVNFSRCEDLPGSSVVTLCRNSPNLSKLILKHCGSVSGRLFHTVALYCRKIQQISVCRCPRMSARDVQVFALHLRRSMVRFSFQDFDDLTLRTFVAYAGRDLQKLKMSDCHKVTNASLVEVGAACPQLTNINLAYCRNVTDAGLQALATLPALQIVSIKCLYEVTHEGLLSLVARKSGEGLKELLMCGNSRVLPGGLQALALHGGCLKTLSLVAMSLSDALLVRILSRCGLLKDLRISNNGHLTDAALEAGLPHCPRLVHLEMEFCELLGDGAMQAIARHCCSMSELDVASCRLITNVGVSAVVSECRALTDLDVTDCPLVSDESAHSMLVHGRRLVSLGLVKTSVSEELARALIVGLHRLRKMAISVEVSKDEAREVNPDLVLNVEEAVIKVDRPVNEEFDEDSLLRHVVKLRKTIG